MHPNEITINYDLIDSEIKEIKRLENIGERVFSTWTRDNLYAFVRTRKFSFPVLPLPLSLSLSLPSTRTHRIHPDGEERPRTTRLFSEIQRFFRASSEMIFTRINPYGLHGNRSAWLVHPLQTKSGGYRLFEPTNGPGSCLLAIARVVLYL